MLSGETRSIHTNGSPKINPDLLQRSEVVALFNVLLRISESLSAVEDFRRMYAEQQAQTTIGAKTAKSTTRRRKGTGAGKVREAMPDQCADY